MSREILDPVRSVPPASAASNAASRPHSRRATRLGPAAVAVVVLLAVGAGLSSLLIPGTLVEHDAGRLAAAVIFAASYFALAIGRIPGLAIDRAGVALVGAALMVACGALSLDEAHKAVDLDTLTLLLGLMIIVANLRLSGFFALAASWIMRRARRPFALLAAVTAIAGVFSAFLVNDAVCLVLAIPAASRLQLDGVPVLSALTAILSNLVSNVPAVAMASTLAGNLTVLGSIANLIVVQRAAAGGVAIGLWDYCRVGAPLTLIALLIGSLWLWI